MQPASINMRRGFNLNASALANRTLPIITIRDYAPADVGYAKVRLTVNHTDTSRQDKAKVFEAICSALDHKAMVVNGTWAVVDSTPAFDVLVGMVSSNKESVMYTDQNASKFRMISSNMFMDDEKSMWALTETDGGKIMVRTTAYDDDKVLDELLKSLSSASTRATKHNGIYDTFKVAASNTPQVDSFCKENSHLVSGGCYAVYTSKSSSKYSGLPGASTGFIVSTVNDHENRATDSVIVLGHKSDAYEVIHRNMLLTLCSPS
jgi:hypothetical protein